MHPLWPVVDATWKRRLQTEASGSPFHRRNEADESRAAMADIRDATIAQFRLLPGNARGFSRERLDRTDAFLPIRSAGVQNSLPSAMPARSPGSSGRRQNRSQLL